MIKLKNLISKLTAPEGLFFDGCEWLVERNKEGGNFAIGYDFDIYHPAVEYYPHRYEVYKQNRFGWWINSGNVVRCTEQLNK